MDTKIKKRQNDTLINVEELRKRMLSVRVAWYIILEKNGHGHINKPCDIDMSIV